MNKNTLKNIGAVIAGFVTVFILSVGTDKVLEKLAIFPDPNGGLFITWMLVVAFLYRSIFTVVGGYVTARLSPNNPMRNVKILGIIGSVAALLGVFAGWNLSAHWYPIALLVTAFPLVWWGGSLYKPTTQNPFQNSDNATL